MGTAVDGLTEFQGPWWGEARVAEALHLTPGELVRARREHRLLAVVFSDAQPYYPARQFVQGADGGWQVVPGLHETLTALAAGIEDPDTWAAWLAGEFEPGTTVWEALTAWRTREIVALARRDVAAWTGP
jgi:hypothetical protein